MNETNKSQSEMIFLLGTIMILGYIMNAYHLVAGNPEHTATQLIGVIIIPVGSVLGLIGY